MATKWISHRGESYDAPENTVPAFRLSQEKHTDGMECDIYFTNDGKVVCNHDGDTGRVSGNFIKAVVSESSFAGLQCIDVSNGKKGYEGTRIPLFIDTLPYLGAGREYYVEIKKGELNMAPELIRIIDDSGIPKEQIVMICFDDAVVKFYKELAPERKALLLVGAAPEVPELIERLKACHADGVDIRFSDNIDAEYVSAVRAAGFGFAVWTVDTPDTARKYLELGVDAITSNRAAWLRDMFC
jgi:glycerophosphoryl diester phosphodiesterase